MRFTKLMIANEGENVKTGIVDIEEFLVYSRSAARSYNAGVTSPFASLPYSKSLPNVSRSPVCKVKVIWFFSITNHCCKITIIYFLKTDGNFSLSNMFLGHPGHPVTWGQFWQQITFMPFFHESQRLSRDLLPIELCSLSRNSPSIGCSRLYRKLIRIRRNYSQGC